MRRRKSEKICFCAKPQKRRAAVSPRKKKKEPWGGAVGIDIGIAIAIEIRTLDRPVLVHLPIRPRSCEQAPAPAIVRVFSLDAGRGTFAFRFTWLVVRGALNRSTCHVSRRDATPRTIHVLPFTSHVNLNANAIRSTSTHFQRVRMRVAVGAQEARRGPGRPWGARQPSSLEPFSIAIAIAIATPIPIPMPNPIARATRRSYASYRGRRPRSSSFFSSSLPLRFFGFAKKHVFRFCMLHAKTHHPAQRCEAPAAQDYWITIG